MTRRLDVDVAAVAAGHLLDDLDHVFLERVHHQISAKSLGDLQTLRLGVEHHQLRRVLQPRRADHAQTKRPGAGEDDEVVELDLAAVHRVHRAGVGFDHRRALERHVVGHLVGARGRRQAHELRHRAVDVVLEAVDVVALAHPVLAALAEAAFVARHDLFRDQPLAEMELAATGDILAKLDGDADELVARNHRRFDIGGLVFAVAPEGRRPVVCFRVAGADAAAFHFNDDVVGTGPRHRHRLEAVIVRRVRHHSVHGVGKRVRPRCCGHLLFPFRPRTRAPNRKRPAARGAAEQSARSLGS